jgi:chromate reductase
MKESFNVAVLLGSLRKESVSRKIAQVLVNLAPPSHALQIVEIGELPLYNPDMEETPPLAWLGFREQIKHADAVLFVTPEYNRSVPAALKNALDVGSRPFGKSVWAGKSGGIVSFSPGALGAFGANHHLRQSLVFLDVYAMQQPEAYFGGTGAWFDTDGNLTDKAPLELLQKYSAAFAGWVERLAQ